MIKAITVINNSNESLTVELANPYESGFAITSIKGLEPVKANITTTDIVTSDGSIYNSSRAENRNIVIEMKLLPAETIEETRQRTYQYFPIKKRVTLIIETDTRTVVTEGYVEKNEPKIFDKCEKTQISILCPESYLASINSETRTIGGVTPEFEFPFSKNEDDDSEIEFGDITVSDELIVFYEGDVNTGFYMNIHALGPFGDLILYNLTTREQMIIRTKDISDYLGFDIQAGDDINISTVRGNKYVYFVRDGLTYNILACIDLDSDWFEFSKGYNRLGFKATTGYENVQFNITNRVLYEGV